MLSPFLCHVSSLTLILFHSFIRYRLASFERKYDLKKNQIYNRQQDDRKKYFIDLQQENIDKRRRNDDEKNLQNKKVINQWNGIMGDLVSGSADMSFAALSVSK